MPIYGFDYRREVSDNIFPYTTLKSSKFKRALFSVHVFDLVGSSEEKCYLLWEIQRKMQHQQKKIKIHAISCGEVITQK